MCSRFCATALENFLVHCTLAAGFWQRSPSSIRQQMSSTSGLFGLPLELIFVLKRAQNCPCLSGHLNIRDGRLSMMDDQTQEIKLKNDGGCLS